MEPVHRIGTMLKPALQLKLGQQLTMTPQLQQAIRLLQLPVLELQAQVREALESNLMLEADDDPEVEFTSLDAAPAAEHPAQSDSDGEAPASDDDERPGDDEVVVELGEDWEASAAPATGEGRGGEGEDRELEFTDERALELHSHLVWQLETSRLDPRELLIGEAIVDALNDDGYLTDSLAEIAASVSRDLPCSVDDVERVLAFVQTLDPVGVGARNLEECLALQLAQLDQGTPARDLAIHIVHGHLQEVADRDLGTLRRHLDCDDDALTCALALIRACHPRPGAAFQRGGAEYVVPDVYVRRTEQGWSVEINAAALPRVRINQTYAGLIARSSDYASLRAQLQEARWLVRSLEIRNETLIKVARAIVQRQHAFLERGDEAMQPMILRDVADTVELHESTISRVTTGKYMLTPRGLFEFRYFFSSHVAGADGEDVSSIAIRARIRRLIADEDSTRPLSDAQLADVLSREGVKVARRTVAKYREAIGLSSSSERRQGARA
jgi:RNA polymerase sigma-54 factor